MVRVGSTVTLQLDIPLQYQYHGCHFEFGRVNMLSQSRERDTESQSDFVRSGIRVKSRLFLIDNLLISPPSLRLTSQKT